MFKLSRAGEYAIRGVVYIASKKGGDAVHIRDIAESQDVPEYFLVKIFSGLARSGIIHSIRGNKGGFKLSKSPGKISMLDVITAVEGPVNLNDCFVCKNSRKCKIEPVWNEANKKMLEVLKQHRIADVV